MKPPATVNPPKRIHVLDHGYVELIDSLGDDLRVSNSARVFEEEWRGNDDVRLIRHMMSNRHTSPFEHVILTYKVKAPIFVFRQWHRHRTWSYNEISGRYQELPEEYYIPDALVIGKQSESDRQSRDINAVQDEDYMHKVRSAMYSHNKDAFRLYRTLLSQGVPRELARTILPLATYSIMYATVNLHNLLHFLDLRLDKHAQWEIQQYARAMLELARSVAPCSVGAWMADEHIEADYL